MSKSWKSRAAAFAVVTTMAVPVLGVASPAGATVACATSTTATVTNIALSTQTFTLIFTLPGPGTLFNAGDQLTISAPATDASITLATNGVPTAVTGPATGPVTYLVPSPYLAPPSGSASVAFDFKLAPAATATISCVHVSSLDLLNAKVAGVGPGKSLSNKVAQANAQIAASDVTGACSTMNAFITEVKAQTGKKIPAATAAELTSDAQAIKTELGC